MVDAVDAGKRMPDWAMFRETIRRSLPPGYRLVPRLLSLLVLSPPDKCPPTSRLDRSVKWAPIWGLVKETLPAGYRLELAQRLTADSLRLRIKREPKGDS